MNKKMSPGQQIILSLLFMNIGATTAVLMDQVCSGVYFLGLGVYAGGMLLRGLSRWDDPRKTK